MWWTCSRESMHLEIRCCVFLFFFPDARKEDHVTRCRGRRSHRRSWKIASAPLRNPVSCLFGFLLMQSLFWHSDTPRRPPGMSARETVRALIKPSNLTYWNLRTTNEICIIKVAGRLVPWQIISCRHAVTYFLASETESRRWISSSISDFWKSRYYQGLSAGVLYRLY